MISLSHQIRQALDSAYRGKIKQLSVKLGFHPTVIRLWRSLKSFVLRLEYRRASSPHEISIGSATASFRFTDERDFRRISTLSDEANVLESFLNELRPTDTVWDVGGNVGTHACLFASVVPEGRVVSFEPHPSYADRLRTNADINGFKNIEVQELGLAEASTTEELNLLASEDELHEGRHTLASADEAVDKMEITLERGDALALDGIPAPNVLKIDVEGAEQRVLRGIKKTLSHPKCRLVLVEVHPHHGVDQSKVVSRLEQAGLTVTDIDERGSESFVFAKRLD